MIRTAVLINQTRTGETPPRLAGLSLPERAVLSAQHAGIEEVLIVGGQDPARWLPSRARLRARWLPVDAPNEVAALRAAREQVQQPFLLLFADSLVEPAALAVLRGNSLGGRLLLRVDPQASKDGVAASVFVANPELLARLDTLASGVETVEELWARCSAVAATRLAEGCTWERTTLRRRLSEVERELNRRSLKPTDGVYARFNKMVVSRPLIYFFLRTPATPNFITGLGLVLGLLSGAAFAMGGYAWAVYGALLAYASAILDHVDGMIARLKFQQSDFGTWFETVVDYASYFALFVGMAIGLYRETRAWHYLLFGGLFIFGTVAAFIVQTRQRKQLSGDRPGDYIRRIHARVEEHSGNFLLWFGRRYYFVVRRAFLPYFILLLCLLNIRGFLLGWAALGVNLMWVLLLYHNRLFVGNSASKSG